MRLAAWGRGRPGGRAGTAGPPARRVRSDKTIG
jgi:hypothetical protein